MQGIRTRPVILIVEDYADTRQMLELLLESLDYDVLTAENGKDALAIALNNHLDLILTDFSLPDMTGPTMVRHLRSLGHDRVSVPVVMLTAFDESQYRELAHQAGCDAFFVKPPDFESLSLTLQRLLHQGQTESDLGATVQLP